MLPVRQLCRLSGNFIPSDVSRWPLPILLSGLLILFLGGRVVMVVHYRFSSFSQSISHTVRSFSVVNVSTIPYNNHLHCNVPNTSFTAKCQQLHFLQDASKSSLQGGNNCVHCKDSNNCLTARCQSFRNNILPFFSFKIQSRDFHSWNVVLCGMFGLWTAAAVVRLCCSIT